MTDLSGIAGSTIKAFDYDFDRGCYKITLQNRWSMHVWLSKPENVCPKCQERKPLPELIVEASADGRESS